MSEDRSVPTRKRATLSEPLRDDVLIPPTARWGEVPLGARQIAAMRRTRRHPRRTQFDYLHVKHLVRDLSGVLASVDAGVTDVLDVFCGTRPYDDLFPAGARLVGLDIPGNPYGLADVVSDEFLPFPDDAFDVVTCIEAFHYLPDPERGVEEIGRVLRPGGLAVVAVPFVWEYDRSTLEHRFTGPELQALFEGWEDVAVIENGGRAVSWATVTGSLAHMLEWHVPARFGLDRLARPAFAGVYATINACGALIDGFERRHARSTLTLPMNLMLTARRPVRAERA